MAQLDYSIGTARTPLNIQPGIQNYFQGQQNKRQNEQSKMLADADQKQKTIADFVSQSMTEGGELDRQALSSRLLNKGWIEDDTAIKSDLMKQDQSIADARQKKMERDQQTMGGIADGILNSEDPQSAYPLALQMMEQERIPIPPNWGPEFTPEVAQMMDMISTRFGQKSRAKAGHGAQEPFNVMEHRYYESLPPEKKKEFLAVKRAQKTLDLGDAHAVLGPDGNIAQSFRKSLRPGELPSTKGAQAQAAESGKISAQVEGAGKLREAKGEISPAEKLTEAKRKFDTTLTGLEGLYKELDEMKAVVNVERGGWDNLIAAVSASGLGQAAGKVLGKKAQSIRNKIETAKPTIINLIREASGMSARGLDSEKELEFYLKSATDTKIDFQANMFAIKTLSELYGAELEKIERGHYPAPSAEESQEGQTKTNADGDKVIFKGGRWQIADQ